MDTEAAALLTTAGTTVAGLMATDAWHQTHDGLVRLWHRFRPERAEAVGRELAEHRAAIVAGPATATTAAGAPPQAALGPLWSQELQELLKNPVAAQELGTLLLACTKAAGQPGDAATATREQRVEAKAKGHGRSYAAGRDMTIIERPGDGS